MIEVSELYLSPQGEGLHLGRPSLFLRLRRCTLHCSWCDTPQTWKQDDPRYQEFATFDHPKDLAQAMLAVVAQTRQRIDAVVLTGGEPLIWQHQVLPALEVFRTAYPCALEVETSGTIMPTTLMMQAAEFNVSHKLASSKNHDLRQSYVWNPHVVRALLQHVGKRDVRFKVVVDMDYDVPSSLNTYLTWLHAVGATVGYGEQDIDRMVYLMPQARTREELVAAQGPIIELAQKLGVNCTTRAHVLAFSNERMR